MFIPNNSCMEEVTLLEKQMIGETRGRERYEGGATAGHKRLIEKEMTTTL